MFLLQFHAVNINVQDVLFQSPLYCAIVHKMHDVAQALVTHVDSQATSEIVTIAKKHGVIIALPKKYHKPTMNNRMTSKKY